MRILASLGVKDEVELLPLALDHLRRIGVDLVIALDWGSTDGSLELLEAAQARGDVVLVPFAELDRVPVIDGEPDSFTDGPWARTPLTLARDLGADWLIFLDTDEFWLPAGGSLRPLAQHAESDVVIVDRRNVPYGPDGPYMPIPTDVEDYGQVMLFGDQGPSRHDLETDPAIAWIASRVLPKVMVRPELVAQTAPGEHDVLPLPGISVRRGVAHDIVIAHLPITTWRRFQRRVANIRQTIERYPGYFAHHGWHWVRFAELEATGRLHDEWERGCLPPATMRRMVGEGAVITAGSILEAGVRQVPD
jgi:hypothetical protein